jgi:two-component system chemotaxis sensor kinase CheA
VTEIVHDFLVETHENLSQLDQDLVTLERDPTERETLSRVFRTFHTVKGTAGFLGLSRLQGVSHAAENLLSRLRAGDVKYDSTVTTTLLGVVDAIRAMLATIEATQQEGDGDYSALVQELERLTSGSKVGLAESKPAPPAPAVSLAQAPARPASLVPHLLATSQSMVSTETPQAEPAAPRAASVADTSVRVDVGLLDKLMTLVGELVLARNQVLQFGATQDDGAFLGTIQRLNLVTTELQAGVLKTRMQPIGTIWGKVPRVVRDLAAACGKQVRIDVEGQDTELDRTVIEAVRDPLTHMIRNAVDHGIEPPAERVDRGKPAEGRIHLRAAHVGGKVVVEISDDGDGIDPVRVRDKAVQNGLVTADQAGRMSDRELVNLIFLPGFSTADRVTHFSGRGVGMDVVRTNIEKVGGTVEVESRLHAGTTVRMTIPLTLAIIPALVVSAGGDRYAIPQVNLLELVGLDGEQSRGRIELLHGTPVYRLRGNLLPIVYLDRQLRVESTRAGDGAAYIVVLQAEDRPFGLVVDDIHDTEEIVVKPLQKQLKGIGVYAGATIMGDGRVALILDIPGLAQRAGIAAGHRDRAPAEPAAAGPAAEREAVLLFTAGGGQMAIPLTQVARLEEFPRSAVERVGGRAVVQYRGEILPLVHVARSLRSPGRRRKARRGSKTATPAARTLKVVVHAGPGKRVGLVVGRILDIAQETMTARAPAARPGVQFTAVVRNRVTEFLDVDGLARAVGVGPAGRE